MKCFVGERFWLLVYLHQKDTNLAAALFPQLALRDELAVELLVGMQISHVPGEWLLQK